MPPHSATDGDPTDEGDHEVGAGLLDEEMGPSSAMAHLYRGEIHRMKYWRQRLDRTSDWAVLVMSGILTWAFTSRTRPHYILLLGLLTLVAFMFVEAHRYRGYDVWRGRVRTLQRNVFAYGLDPAAGLPDPEWRRTLSQDYRHPVIKISREESLAHRLRRIYLLLFGIVVGAWVFHVTTFSPTPWPASAAIGSVPCTVVTAVLFALYLAAVVVAVRPREWQSEDELHEREVGRHR